MLFSNGIKVYCCSKCGNPVFNANSFLKFFKSFFINSSVFNLSIARHVKKSQKSINFSSSSTRAPYSAFFQMRHSLFCRSINKTTVVKLGKLKQVFFSFSNDSFSFSHMSRNFVIYNIKELKIFY